MDQLNNKVLENYLVPVFNEYTEETTVIGISGHRSGFSWLGYWKWKLINTHESDS